MTQDYKTILKMIEEVDPNDTAKLDEIDARVTFWMNNVTFEKPIYHQEKNCSPSLVGKLKCWRTKELGDVHRWLWSLPSTMEYKGKVTRSRDALKAIRPNGWMFYEHGQDMVTGIWYTTLINLSHGGKGAKHSGDQLTEELAELHVIIQAIAYERGLA